MYSAHIRGFRAGGLAVDRNLRAEPSDGQRGRQRLNHDEDAKRHPEPKPKHLAEQEATHTESSEQCEDVQAHRLSRALSSKRGDDAPEEGDRKSTRLNSSH